MNKKNISIKQKQLLQNIKCDHRDIKNINSDNVKEGFMITLNEYQGGENDEFKVEFYDTELPDKVYYTTTISPGQWTKVHRKWYSKWRVVIKELQYNEVIFEYISNLENKIVLIVVNTDSLGDIIAWLPQVEEFRKKHNCKIICWLSDNYSYLFKKTYSHFKFISDNNWSVEAHAKYNISWETYTHRTEKESILNYNDFDTAPENYQQISLWKHASNILGLEEKLIKPNIEIPNISRSSRHRDVNKKYVCISTHSTAQAKYWNYGGDYLSDRDYGIGWQIIINYLNNIGYGVIVLNEHPVYGDPTGKKWNEHIFTDVIDKTGNISLVDRLIDLNHAEFFIGLNSGMSWLAWAIGVPVVNIINLQPPELFYPSEAVHQNSDDICHDCCLEYAFQKNDWLFCPKYKGTNKQFECSTTITPKMVIEKIDGLILKLSKRRLN
mgnify:CR=1 FL=1